MKFKSLLGIFAILMISSAALYSQDKVAEEQLGFGVEVGTSNWFGGHGVYALNQDMHLGVNLGFMFDGGTDLEPSTTNLLFAPYFRYFLPKLAKSLKPFGEATFLINTGSEYEVNPNDPNTKTTHSFTETALRISVGAYWFPYSSVGIYGGFRFLNLGLDPMRIKVGIGQAFMGIDWWMDK